MNWLQKKVMKKWTPWQSKEKYEKVYSFFEPICQEDFIIEEISYYYPFNKNFIGTNEYIYKKFPLPNIPSLLATEKEWQQFIDNFLEQKNLQVKEVLKLIYKGKYDIPTCEKKFRVRLILVNFASLSLIIGYFVFLLRIIRIYY